MLKNTPWLTDSLRSLRLQRHKAKEAAKTLGSDNNKQFYNKLRNRVTKINYIKKREYYKPKIRCASGENKKI